MELHENVPLFMKGEVSIDFERSMVINMKGNKARKTTLTAYLFLSPWILGFLFFSGVPILEAFFISLTNWDIVHDMKFIGLSNYAELVQSGEFWNSLKVTLIYTIGSMVVTMLWALLMAMLLNMKSKLTIIYQFIYFIPAVMPTVTLAFVLQLILHKELGIFNYILSFLGIAGKNWLYDPKYAMATVILIGIFTYSTGQMMLIFKASLKEVPLELYEAASIDGAGFISKFFKITLPSMSPIILFNMVMAAISSLNNSFSLIFPLTEGGPNGATNVLSLNIYNMAFKNYRMGYASALAIVLFIVAALISIVQFVMSKKWVYYEN